MAKMGDRRCDRRKAITSAAEGQRVEFSGHERAASAAICPANAVTRDFKLVSSDMSEYSPEVTACRGDARVQAAEYVFTIVRNEALKSLPIQRVGCCLRASAVATDLLHWRVNS